MTHTEMNINIFSRTFNSLAARAEKANETATNKYLATKIMITVVKVDGIN